MAKLHIFIDKTPLYVNYNVILRVGLFGDDYSLTEVTQDCNFNIKFGDEYIRQIKNNKFIAINSGDVGIQALFKTEQNIKQNILKTKDLAETAEYIATTSFVIISEVELPDRDDIYACIKREEPSGVYIQNADANSFTYVDNQATADVFAALYQNLQTEANHIYPELSTDYTDWLTMLFSEVYINTEQGQINKLLQLMRNLQILTSMNPYDIAQTITTYIYYRTNQEIYVYIEEGKVNFDKAWILGTNKSILGINTYLQKSQVNTSLIINIFDTEQKLSRLFRIELENFISKISRAYFSYSIDYDKTPAEFQLNYDIGMTYKGDQRVIYSYCLKYADSAFYKVVGLINPIQPAYIKDMLITPADNAAISVPTKLTVTGIFIGNISAEITLGCQISKNNDNLRLINDVLIPNKNGKSTLTISYGSITRIVAYTSEV